VLADELAQSLALTVLLPHRLSKTCFVGAEDDGVVRYDWLKHKVEDEETS